MLLRSWNFTAFIICKQNRCCYITLPLKHTPHLVQPAISGYGSDSGDSSDNSDNSDGRDNSDDEDTSDRDISDSGDRWLRHFSDSKDTE